MFCRPILVALPKLVKATIVRSWAALRVMTPDGTPIYQQAPAFPGAFVASVHRGVTLAAAHAGPLAEAIAEGSLPPFFSAFAANRFDVPQAA